MEGIKKFIESLAVDWGDRLGVAFPLLLAGLVALYLAYLVLGYLRVSQVAIEAEASTARPALPIAAGTNPVIEAPPRGVPYCSYDGLQYPPGARFCTACERDLSYDCTNCGTTLRAADESCYRCGTPTAIAEPALPG
jgi:double zinc ribbon protein